MTQVIKNNIGFIIGIFLFLFFLFANPLSVNVTASKVLAIAVLMIVLWVSEALPMPVVALFPIVLFPLFKVASMEETAAPYANSVIFLFMGGFLIGLAIEKWDLHKRIALNIVKKTGTSGNRIILGFILSTGFLSMWLSNTATTMMMFPIALSVIKVMELNHEGDGNISNMSVCILLAIAYAANFGGMATIIGTPPNVAFSAFINKKYNYNIQFSDWMMVCTPIAILLMFALYIVTTKFLYPNHIKSSLKTARLIQNEINLLGKLSKPEKKVLVVFIMTAFLWIVKDLINAQQKLIKLDDTMIAMVGALLLFIIPSSDKNGKSKTLLEWKDTAKMAWGILILFGGGITLANQLEKAGLIEMLGVWLAQFSNFGTFWLILIIVIISIFISEVMSNVAQVIVFAPVIAGISDALHVSPLLLGIPMALSASAASMLPMGTPPNAIVFGSGKLQLKQMVKTGFVMNIIAIILITLISWVFIPYMNDIPVK